MRRLIPHPLAQLLPRMTPEEFAALRDSIAAHGLREPITLHQDGRILDGIHREEICRELGTPLRIRTFEGPESDLLSFVLDQNLHRRHLSESQRAIIPASPDSCSDPRDSRSSPAPLIRDKRPSHVLYDCWGLTATSDPIPDHRSGCNALIAHFHRGGG